MREEKREVEGERQKMGKGSKFGKKGQGKRGKKKKGEIESQQIIKLTHTQVFDSNSGGYIIDSVVE